MCIYVDWPEECVWEPDDAVPQTEPERQEDLWHYRFPWIKTAVGASPYDDSLMIDNRTQHNWMLWHRYHALEPIPPGDQRSYRLVKTGLLTARQYPPPPQADYVLLELTPMVSAVAIVDVSSGEGFYALQVLDLLDWQSADDREAASPVLPITRTIEELDLSARTENALKRAGITTVDQLKSASVKELLSLKGLGRKERRELIKRLYDGANRCVSAMLPLSYGTS